MISLADFGCRVNHVKHLVSLHLQNLWLLNFDSEGCNLKPPKLLGAALDPTGTYHKDDSQGYITVGDFLNSCPGIWSETVQYTHFCDKPNLQLSKKL